MSLSSHKSRKKAKKTTLFIEWFLPEMFYSKSQPGVGSHHPFAKLPPRVLSHSCLHSTGIVIHITFVSLYRQSQFG